MQVTLNKFNGYNQYQQYNSRNVQPRFTGNPTSVAKEVTQSKFFEPARKLHGKLVDWLTENYYSKLANSNLAIKFAEYTKKLPQDKADMTKHMSALGATLISGMYVIKTLQNDKLDKEKRKTLAINDALTWGISTAGAYGFDKYLAKWCDNVTTRFAANYFLKNPESKNIELLGDWNPANIEEVVKTAKYTALKKYETMKASLSHEEFTKWLEKVNMKEKHFEYLKDFDIKSISDLNSQLLKNEKLDIQMRGIGVLKTLFVFGMVYRYLVPVLVMKPANKIGAYIHQKKVEKQQTQQTQKA